MDKNFSQWKITGTTENGAKFISIDEAAWHSW
jgi:hypothetical protein